MNETTNAITLPRAHGLLDLVKSIGWAFLGVQSSANRKRDFSSGKPVHYLIAACVGTLAVVLLFYGAAQLAIHLAATP